MKSYGFGSKNQFLQESCHNKAAFLVVQAKMNTLSADQQGSGLILAGEAYGKGSIPPAVILGHSCPRVPKLYSVSLQNYLRTFFFTSKNT